MWVCEKCAGRFEDEVFPVHSCPVCDHNEGDDTDVRCLNCGDCDEGCEFCGDSEPNDSMDGDFDSGMASAGFGTDEDYGDYSGGEDY